MTRSHDGWSGLRALRLATGLLILTCLVVTHGRAQSTAPEAARAEDLSEMERARRLAERARLVQEYGGLGRAGKWKEAAAVLGKKLVIERELLGQWHEDVVATLGTRAQVFDLDEDWASARDDLKEVLAIREHQPDPKEWRIADARRALEDLDRRAAMDPDRRLRLRRADALNRAVVDQYLQGKHAAAKTDALEALRIRQEVLGEHHPDYAQSLFNLATQYGAMGDSGRAEPLLRQALEIEKKALGESHPTYAASLNGLATLYRGMGDYARAEPLLRQALEIRKQVLGESHPEYAQSLNNLAWLYRAMGDYARAEPLFRQALEIRKQAQGEHHPEYATSLNNLAALYWSMGDYAHAEPLLRQALEIQKQVLGEHHPGYALSLFNLAAQYAAMGDYVHAEPLYRQALEIRKQALGEHHPDYAHSLNSLALVYQNMGDYARAEPLFRQALEIRKQALGEHHPDYATSLNNLATLYWSMRDHARAEPLFRQALEVRKQALGEQHLDYATSLNNLATVYRDRGDYARAEPLDRQALEITKKARGESHPDFATSLNNLAALYEAMGDYARAEPLDRQALEIRKQALGERHPHYATSLDKLATLYRDMGDYAHAEPLVRQALEIRKQALGEHDPDYATSLDNLATLYRDMGDYAHAEPLVRQALEIRKQAQGEHHPDYATSLNNLAALYEAMGDYARAEPLDRQALEIRKQAQGERHPHYATSLNNLAWLYQDMGDYARAEPLYRQALEIDKQALGEHHPEYATSLNNLATLYRALGDYARAEPLSRQVLEIRKLALGERHPKFASSLNNLAALYWSMGDYARAEPLLRRVLEIQKQALGEHHPYYAMSLFNLAAQYQAMGDYGRAEPLYRQAMEIRKQALGEHHPDYANSLNSLALLYQALGDSARAEPLLLESLDKGGLFLRATSAVLGERQRLRLLGAQRGTLDAYLSVSPTDGSRPAGLYRHVLDWKGAVETQQADDRLVRDEPALRPLLEQLTGVRARLAHLAFATPTDARRTGWRQQFDALRERKEDLEADLARQSAAFRGQQQAGRLGPEELTAALPEGTALVDLLVYTHYSPPEGGKGAVRKESRLIAFVVRRGRPVALIPLGAAPPIDAAVTAWRQALETHQAGALGAAAAELDRQVWAPLRPHLAGARTVLIAPDGPLVWFPFAALPGSRPGSYLIEDVAIGYVGSGRQAAAALADPAGPAGRGLLAVGAVDFQADPGQTSPADRPTPTPGPAPIVAERAGFRSLPATGPEAKNARALFHAAFAGQPDALLTGAEATEAELKHRLDGGQWRIVHLATHGFFESPARVAALRAAIGRTEDSPFPRLVQAATDREDDHAFELMPLLRSGVVLAGGGRDPGTVPAEAAAGTPPRQDGILTAEEVVALDLRGTELVVLSACDTGLGRLEHGQGVLGLQRAFQAAGARAVVASLWKVDDAATGALMERFYTNLWTRKLPKLEALRQAQLAVLNDPGLVERHRVELTQRGLGQTAEKLPGGGVPATGPGVRSEPALWAAFVLGGDGR